MCDPERKKVIVAGDDVKKWRKEIEKRIEGALEEGSYELTVYENCDPIAARIEEGGVDLAVLDVLMEGKSPWEEGAGLARWIKEKHPEVKVVMFSGAWDDMQPVDRDSVQQQTQADAVVFKDDLDPELDDLGAQVKRLLGG